MNLEFSSVFATAGPGRLAYVPPMREEVLRFRGNFCNLREGTGPVFGPDGRLVKGKGILYDPAMPGVWLSDYERFRQWIRRHQQEGTTHLTFGPFEGGEIYPGSEFVNPDMLSDLALLRRFIEEIVTTPAADGKGFRVLLQLDGGAPNPRPRIDGYWKRVLDAIADFLPSCIVSPGWELIASSDWTSADYSYALLWLGRYRRQLQAERGITFLVGAHLSPGRSAWTSNPIEASDPLQGAEAECWTDPRYGGTEVDVFLFQFPPPHAYDRPGDCRVTVPNGRQMRCSQHDVGVPENESRCWMDRGWDSILRIGTGDGGAWRTIFWVAFETVAFVAWHEGTMRVKGVEMDATGAKAYEPDGLNKLPLPSLKDARGPHWKRLGTRLAQAQAAHLGVHAVTGALMTTDGITGAQDGAGTPFATTVANTIKTQLADRLGLSIGYGNGLPDEEAA